MASSQNQFIKGTVLLSWVRHREEMNEDLEIFLEFTNGDLKPSDRKAFSQGMKLHSARSHHTGLGQPRC